MAVIKTDTQRDEANPTLNRDLLDRRDWALSLPFSYCPGAKRFQQRHSCDDLLI